jgi:hypothetical protein
MGKIHFWRVADGKKVAELPIPQIPLAATLSLNARLLATYDPVKGLVTVWEIATKKQLHQWHLGAGIDELRFSPDGKQLLAWGGVGRPSCKLILLSIADGKRTDLYIDSGALESAAFSPVEPFVAAGIYKSWDLLASLRSQRYDYSCPRDKSQHSLPLGFDHPAAMGFEPDTKRLPLLTRFFS